MIAIKTPPKLIVWGRLGVLNDENLCSADNQELFTDTTDCESLAKSEDLLDDISERVRPDSQEPDDNKDDFAKVCLCTVFVIT